MTISVFDGSLCTDFAFAKVVRKCGHSQPLISYKIVKFIDRLQNSMTLCHFFKLHVFSIILLIFRLSSLSSYKTRAPSFTRTPLVSSSRTKARFARIATEYYMLRWPTNNTIDKAQKGNSQGWEYRKYAFVQYCIDIYSINLYGGVYEQPTNWF